MRRYPSIIVVIVIMTVYAGLEIPVNGQSATPPFDYFTFDKGPGSYLSLVESAHVEVVPAQFSTPHYALENIIYTLDRFPNHPIALQQLTIVAKLVKNSLLGVQYFEKAISLYPQYALTRAQYGLFLLTIDQIDSGIEKFKQATKMEPKLTTGYAGLAEAYVRKGDLEHAREAAQKARELGFNGKLPAGL